MGLRDSNPLIPKPGLKMILMTCSLDRFIEVLFIAIKLILLRMKFHDF